MLVRPADPVTETIVLEDATDEDNALYILHYIAKDASGGLHLGRNIWFDRLDLSIVRQKVLDRQRAISSAIRATLSGSRTTTCPFPSHIDINRPQDGYGVVMDVVQLQMNKSLTDEQFVLNQSRRLKAANDRGGATVIFKLVWENVRFRPLRTLLSVLLIAVPVTLILTLIGLSNGFIEDSKKRSTGVGARHSGQSARRLSHELQLRQHARQTRGRVCARAPRRPGNGHSGCADRRLRLRDRHRPRGFRQNEWRVHLR